MDTSNINTSPEERARGLDYLLKEDKTYSIAFICSGRAFQEDGQTKAQVVKKSRLYQHFQVFQPGELNLAGFEAMNRDELTKVDRKL